MNVASCDDVMIDNFTVIVIIISTYLPCDLSSAWSSPTSAAMATLWGLRNEGCV